MNDAASQTELDGEKTLQISRVFAAPRETVFRAWSDPKEFSKWWGPEGCTARCELEPRTGGAWRSIMLHGDGEENIVSGVYLEFKAPERLVFTWAWETDGVRGHETVVSLDFFDRGGSTEIVLNQETFEGMDMRNKHNGGWSSSFDCLERHLAGGGEAE